MTYSNPITTLTRRAVGRLLTSVGTLTAALLLIITAAPAAHAVIGGSPAVAGQFPTIVSVQKNGKHFCGGSLVRADWVLTAAQCVDRATPSQFKVTGGLLGLGNTVPGVTETREVVRIVKHQGFSESNAVDDIALIQLKAPMLNLTTAALPTQGQKFTGKATVAGWGSTSQPTPRPTFRHGPAASALRYVSVSLLSDPECKRQNGASIRPGMICAGDPNGGKDACTGDAGGPLVHNGKLVGIVSWGNGCANPGTPGVYTETARYRTWIDSKLA
ncbi:serine protease [Streptomyces sp. NBC_01304]|uniref:serine protease n=1 Tax=Streptomyces sp. NBC_01304 TaxID=2903818 RepID=UPI002E118CE6|nr:serine protease [Streptomyces sp. NBC_01304]